MSTSTPSAVSIPQMIGLAVPLLTVLVACNPGATYPAATVPGAPTSSAGDEHEGGRPAPEALSFFESLVGSWSGRVRSAPEPREVVELDYRVVAGGTAVEERLFAGTPGEMVTMYHGGNEANEVVLTHYCRLGNQPRLRLARADETTLEFEYLDGTGFVRERDGHMGALKLVKVNEDEFLQEWTFYRDGAAQRTKIYEFERVLSL